MTTEILNQNLTLLKSLHPNAYEAVINSKPNRHYEITLSKSGHPTLLYIKPNKFKVHLLSKYDPLREAKSYIDSLRVDNFTNFIVLGMGLGYHIGELVKSVHNDSKIIVIENDKKLARLAFENNDLSQVLQYPGLTLCFSSNFQEIISSLEPERINFSLNGYQLVQQSSLSKVNSKETNAFLKELNIFFQTSKIDLNTNTAKSKIFSNNIFKNYQCLLTSPGINTLNGSFANIPAIICSAGPSLDKNIQLLKAKKDNFLLISAATALKPLLENNISPDFVVAIDPDEVTIKFFNLKKKLMNTWLIYDPVIPTTIPAFFEEKRVAYDSSINLAQWLQKHIGKNGSLGSVFSVAHAAYQSAKLVGCSPIILIGQDLSFSKKRLHARNSYYFQEKEDCIGKLKTREFLENLKFQNYSNNVLERKGIFNNFLKTTVSLETYAQMFSSAMVSSQETFNATEGGIGIKGVKNISLHEAINNHCSKKLSIDKNNILNSIPCKSFKVKTITESAKKLATYFTETYENLNRLEGNYLKGSTISGQNKEGFVQEMKSIIQNLLKNKEATLLLQGYDFSGFSLWNQKTNEILKKKSSALEKDLVCEEFNRDREFFRVLKSSVEFNKNIFEKFMKTEISI